MRNLAEISDDINDHWEKPYFGAIPYLKAMSLYREGMESFGADSWESIVEYFLTNARTWKGEDARRIKAELKAWLKEKGVT